MKFLELNVHGFGQFGSQKTIKFQDGVNVILGPNESGKSTLHNAILASLYQPSKADFDLYASWKNPDVFKARLTYQISNGEIFRISRDLKSKKVLVEKQEGDEFIEVTKTEREAKKIISTHVGFPEKRVFENTVCVNQGEMTALKDKIAIKQIKDIISNLITGTEDTSANKAIETIDTKIKEIEGGLRSNGRLDSLNSEIQGLKSSLDEVKNEQDTLDIAKPEKSNYLLYIGIIIFLIGVFGMALINSLFIICILIGIILVILHLIKSKSNNMVAVQTRIEQFESTIHEKESSIEKVSRQIESYYSSLPANNLKELSENFEISSNKTQKKANLVSQKDILLGKNQLDELEKKRDGLLIEVGKIDVRLEELGELNLSAEEQIKCGLVIK